jgi:hypothetical protein
MIPMHGMFKVGVFAPGEYSHLFADTTLVSAKFAAGSYKYDWDASGLASGVYLYRMKAGEFQQIKKMILIK